MSMARLSRDQGRRDGAYDLLAPVYNWLAEGFDTLDPKEAKALLGELVSFPPLGAKQTRSQLRPTSFLTQSRTLVVWPHLRFGRR